jgi:hypothetical protein
MRMRTRWLTYTAAAAILASTLTALVAEPASAVVVTAEYLEGVERFSLSTSTDYVERKELTVACPEDKVVVGAGWSTSPSSGELLVEDLIPTENNVTAVVREDADGYGVEWRLTVNVVCAFEPPDYSIEKAIGLYNSNSSNLTQVDCPDETVALGLGFSITDESGTVVLNAADHASGPVTVSAYEHGTFTDSWWIDAFAICAAPPIGWQVLDSSNQTTYPHTYESTGCYAGQTAISTGAYLIFAVGQVSISSLKTYTYFDGDSAAASANEDDNGTENDWDLYTEAVCVNTPPN